MTAKRQRSLAAAAAGEDTPNTELGINGHQPHTAPVERTPHLQSTALLFSCDKSISQMSSPEE